MPKDTKPLAGRFSKIGEQILLIGNQNARQIITGPWNDAPIESPKQMYYAEPP